MEDLNERLFLQHEADLLLEIITNRRDVRGNRFTDETIEEEKISQILEAAVNAPSVGFSQPWQFVIIKSKEIKEQVKSTFNTENEKASKLFKDEKQQEYNRLKLEGIFEAPLNIAIFYAGSDKPILGQTSMAEVGMYSVVCAIQNMWLMARALNIGMGWVSIIDPEKVKQILKAPKDNKLIGYFCLGYTNGFLQQPELELLKWENRKKLSELIFNETY
ncbi:cob(II)yrinic acid a,c-diamide reductase [Mucilaginibacter frigoritolerans]|uniref:Cob(II)yrinic acid a,c-diamide reductase n=1 Tax=Mucilaginibacter frigoritolerans TaxID=652788 RepID=A0A562U6U2_9SPHI|nr:5,6-dimethylbenzimidazole synthase [Mucilaginibacter frigoritolerans]TWJ00891.1 cob(II)yrinic acid a,c-diamide reductase [Mucilaginibacter frigoritolerans]